MATRLGSGNFLSYVSGMSYGNSGESIAQGFDGNNGSKLCNTNFSSIKPFWVILDAKAIYFPQATYTIYSGNDDSTRDPTAWTIAGSNDNSTYTTIHSVSGRGAFAARSTAYNFTLDATKPWRYYKITVSANVSSSIMQFNDWQLFVTDLARYITYNVGEGGTVSNSSGYVRDGATVSTTVTANSGYQIESVLVGGTEQAIDGKKEATFSFTASADTTVEIKFTESKGGTLGLDYTRHRGPGFLTHNS